MTSSKDSNPSTISYHTCCKLCVEERLTSLLLHYSLSTQYSVVTILLPHSPLNPNPPGVTAYHVAQIWVSSTQIVWSNRSEKARFAGEKGLCVVEIGGLRLLLALEYQGLDLKH
ncbi:hypothetical protein PIB30_036087 [Stylosanthes scabra]|uniref:Uncharacterized protein n=1 Tax=Stylosanthes scabra TaxID=79078 RepID=A0ABU6SEW8_9FABA|nr:hypothetical protein [Stylosanthes scabra]